MPKPKSKPKPLEFDAWVFVWKDGTAWPSLYFGLMSGISRRSPKGRWVRVRVKEIKE